MQSETIIKLWETDYVPAHAELLEHYPNMNKKQKAMFLGLFGIDEDPLTSCGKFMDAVRYLLSPFKEGSKHRPFKNLNEVRQKYTPLIDLITSDVLKRRYDVPEIKTGGRNTGNRYYDWQESGRTCGNGLERHLDGYDRNGCGAEERVGGLVCRQELDSDWYHGGSSMKPSTFVSLEKLFFLTLPSVKTVLKKQPKKLHRLVIPSTLAFTMEAYFNLRMPSNRYNAAMSWNTTHNERGEDDPDTLPYLVNLFVANEISSRSDSIATERKLFKAFRGKGDENSTEVDVRVRDSYYEPRKLNANIHEYEVLKKNGVSLVKGQWHHTNKINLNVKQTLQHARKGTKLSVDIRSTRSKEELAKVVLLLKQEKIKFKIIK